MKLGILSFMMPQLFSMLTPELLKKAADAVLDVIEDAVAKSDNNLDNEMILPIVKIIRTTFDIPDLPDKKSVEAVAAE